MTMAVEQWGPVVFATVVPCLVLIIGALVHAAFRLGRLDQDVKGLRRDVNSLIDRKG